MVTTNGERLDIAGKTVAEYLASAGYDTKRVAALLNGDVLPKANYEKTVLKDEDHLEVVCFVGGG